MGPIHHTTGGEGTVPHPDHTTGGGGGRSHMGPVYGTHPPHHRGGRGTVPHPHHTTGGEGEDLIWDQYMGPIPYGGGGRAWCIYIYIYVYIYIYIHKYMCVCIYIYTHLLGIESDILVYKKYVYDGLTRFWDCNGIYKQHITNLI